MHIHTVLTWQRCNQRCNTHAHAAAPAAAHRLPALLLWLLPRLPAALAEVLLLPLLL